jgi:hypothetical protein
MDCGEHQERLERCLLNGRVEARSRGSQAAKYGL